MAATPRDVIQELCEEATCSLCLDYFTDPVTIECGHNFCQGCLTQCWQQLDQEVCCPQCRKSFQPKNLVPNWQLANFVEITKKLRHLGGKGALAKEVKGEICEKHQEPLKLFCKTDRTAICVVCDRSLGHRNHEVVPVEEAAQQCKNQICIHLEFMKKEREKMLAYEAETEKECQDLLKQMNAEIEKTVANFRQLHQFLEEQEMLLLAKMELAVKEITKARDKGWMRISKEFSFVESLVQEMEEKCQQPHMQLLQDDRSIFLSNMEKVTFAYPMAFPPELKWEIWDSREISSFLASVMKQFRDALISGQQWQKANVTLDQDTAHPQLILSPDHKSVRLGEKCQKLPKKEERFTEKYIVLGCKGFTAGRHFWDVAVGNEEEWAVGVARKSVKRKGSIEFNPKGGIWEMGKWGGQYRAPNPSPESLLRLGKEPKRIRVSLNSAAGEVAFYDADTAAAVYTFSAASFAGETLLPFFWVRQKGYLRVS
ncbi:E3 ubiquitin-protein ligase TRIM7-like [Sceloporus undulatus]|uniref:E3 ubiquitin-protein ligase TRIM7-like n=1 Tax=Sceloporus undulatus TaxID=8520 RepID=UPI001C4D76DF|nr:E3 ubiquitin-protein ligase TRIM7-like [Sceloporus undulatus]